MAATSALEARITTKELRRSAENHVTLIGSHLSSVNAGIANELRMVKSLLEKNEHYVKQQRYTHPEDLLQTLLSSQTELELYKGSEQHHKGAGNVS